MTQMTTGKGFGRGGRILLVASLAVNLLIVGAVIGTLVSGGRSHNGGPRGDGPDQALRNIGNAPFIMALTRSDREQLVKSMGGRSALFRENRERLRARFEAVLAVLRASDFDAEALRTLLAEQRDALFERQKLGEDVLISRLAQMSADERAAYADRLDRSLRRGPRKTPPKP